MESKLFLQSLIIATAVLLACDACDTDVYFNGSKVNQEKCICDEKLCLRKCCPFGKVFDFEVLTKTNFDEACVNTEQEFIVPMYDENGTEVVVNSVKLFHYTIGLRKLPKEEYDVYLLSMFEKKVNLKTDGRISLKNENFNSTLSPEFYCIDNFKYFNTEKNTYYYQLDAFFSALKYQPPSSHYKLLATCKLLSCVCILLTLGVYIVLPELHTVHGRLLTMYLGCFFVAFLFIAIMQLLVESHKATVNACHFMTYVIYISLQCTFFWLNVMCYDIWRLFNKNNNLSSSKPVWVKIRRYAIYAFGVPTILTILLAALINSGLPQHNWLPSIIEGYCFLIGNSLLIYLYGPLTILCVANLILFTLTALKIAIIVKKTSVLNSKESARSDDKNKQRLFLYVKLFIVMGISWILEGISAVYPSDKWIYTDVYNDLTGLFVFIIFVCKRKIFLLLKKRYRKARNIPSQNHTPSGRTTEITEETEERKK